MYFMGVLFITLGGWLVDSGIQNRHPISTLEALIIGGPNRAKEILVDARFKLDAPAPTNLGDVASRVGDAAKDTVNAIAPGKNWVNLIPVAGPWITGIESLFQ